MGQSAAGDNTYAGELEERLKQEHILVMDEEQRLSLLIGLKNKGLTTRDIMSFIKNQADLRSVLKGLDKATSNLAMNSKIQDKSPFPACEYCDKNCVSLYNNL